MRFGKLGFRRDLAGFLVGFGKWRDSEVRLDRDRMGIMGWVEGKL
jgi:hypothetical protein